LFGGLAASYGGRDHNALDGGQGKANNVGKFDKAELAGARYEYALG